MSPILLRRMTDEQLGRRLASGEAAAFDELYRRYAHRLAAYGAHLLGDGPAGDDVAQTVLLKAYGAFRDGRVPDHVKPWLYRVAHNAAIDLVKRRRELPAAVLPDRAASASPDSGALVAALATLPERQRRVYVLRELHGLRVDETATELGLTPVQVEQAQFAARNRLAEHLVFGDRLDCVAVQRLSAGPLDADERRALKTHLRSCPSCRAAVGVRGRIVASLPLSGLEWLRALGGLGAPAAAKIGAVVAGAGVAAAVPVAAERNPPHHLPAPTPVAHVHVVRAQPRATHPVVRLTAPAPVVATVRAPVAAPAPVRVSRPREERRHATEVQRVEPASTERESEPAPAPAPATTTVEDAPAPAVTTTTPTTTSSGDGGGPGPSAPSTDGDGGGTHVDGDVGGSGSGSDG